MTGTAVIVCGSPGAGKSTYGKQLAAQRRAVLLDIDTVTERLVRLALHEAGRDPDDRDSPAYKHTFRQPIYDTLFDIARENLPWTDVVIVGPFTRELRDPNWPQKLQNLFGAPLEVQYVTCDPQQRHQRMQQRQNPRDAQKLVDWHNHAGYYGTEEPPPFPHVLINTTVR